MKLGLAAFAALVLLVGTSGSAVAAPSCYGAAARDAALPCVNPSLRLKVTPQPRNAPLVRGTPCTKLPPEGVVVPCEFGVLAANARTHFALVGDSHAAHWRPTLAEMARGLQWHGYQLSRNSCSLTTVPLAQPEPYFSECGAWKTQAAEWLGRHPEVTTVFLTTKTPGPRDFAPNPEPAFETQVQGHLAAWSWLPASVTRVFVIRDSPSARVTTMDCVRRAVARRRVGVTAPATPDPHRGAGRRARGRRRRLGRGLDSPTGPRSCWSCSPCWWSRTRPRCGPTSSSASTSTRSSSRSRRRG